VYVDSHGKGDLEDKLNFQKVRGPGGGKLEPELMIWSHARRVHFHSDSKV